MFQFQPTLAFRSPQPSVPSFMAEDEEEEEEEGEVRFLVLPKPSDLMIKMIYFQADLLHNCLLSLFSPIFFFMSLAWACYREAEETTSSLKMAVYRAPSKLTRGTRVLLKKMVYGCVGAVKMWGVLVGMVVLSAVLGLGLVGLVFEEPVFVKEVVWFDYADAHPKALFSFTAPPLSYNSKNKMRPIHGIPVGHAFHVSLMLLMPDSHFNAHIGMFQVRAEIISSKGEVLARSSQPCMVKYKSLPIRLTRSLFMAIPLFLGFSSETQLTTIQILRHIEGKTRTDGIRVSLIPRAETSSLPQLYQAEIIIISKLPWTKQILHNWKWTFYVWTCFYIYFLFLLIFLFCCKPFSTSPNYHQLNPPVPAPAPAPAPAPHHSKPGGVAEQTLQISDQLITAWRRSRRDYKRKTAVIRDRFVPSSPSTKVHNG